MTKGKGTAERRTPQPTEVDMDIETETGNCEDLSPSNEGFKEKRPSVSQEQEVRLFEEDTEYQPTEYQRGSEVAMRPPPAGYRIPGTERRFGQDWENEYRIPYAQAPNEGY